jgi:outer membrane protein assembly factor BamA
VHATRGLLFDVGGSVHPALLSVNEAFGEVHGEGAAYLTAPGYLAPTLALRIGGKKVWGTFPFHEAATVGGKDTVRGYLEQRFAGDGSAYGNAELRFFLTRFSFLSPGDLGVFFLGDAGRVFLEGEDSKRWHGAFGGGIWLSFVERRNTVSVAVVRSPEKTGVYARLGFLF